MSVSFIIRDLFTINTCQLDRHPMNIWLGVVLLFPAIREADVGDVGCWLSEQPDLEPVGKIGQHLEPCLDTAVLFGVLPTQPTQAWIGSYHFELLPLDRVDAVLAGTA